MIQFLKKLFRVKETTAYSANPWGDPIPYSALLAQIQNNYVTARDLFPYKPTTVRSMEQQNAIMFLGRQLFERNPNAKGVLTGLKRYVVGKGFEVKVCDQELEEEEDVQEEVQQAAPPEQEEPVVDGPKVSPLAKKIQKLLDSFCERMGIKDWYDDVFIRGHRDGDCFVRMFIGDDGAEIRAIEPDSVRPPTGKNWEGEWSLGIQTPVDDWATPLAYGVQLFGQEWNTVPADQVFHLKLNVSSNVKRGLSSFLCVQDTLLETDTLRSTFRGGEIARAAVAYFRQWSKTPKEAIVALQTSAQTGSTQEYDRNTPMNGPFDYPQQREVPGTVKDVPKNMELMPPVELSGAGVDIAVRQALYAVACAWNVPSWLVTGESNDTTYASSTTAEAPFQHNIMDQQEVQTKFWKRIFEGVVKVNIARGNLPEDALELIEIHVDAPSSGSRSKDAVDTTIALRDAGLMSDQTAAAEMNLDYAEEVEKGAMKAALPLDPNKQFDQPEKP